MNAPELQALQSWMRQALSGRAEAGAPDLSHTIVDGEPMTRARRLNVYAEAYYWRLVECLQDDFESVMRACGNEGFPALVDAFLKVHPSRSFTVADVGRELSGFLRGRSDVPAYAADFAAIDRAFQEAFYADALPPLDRAVLSTIAGEDWPRVRFGIDSSVRLLANQWAVEEAWREKDWDAATIAERVRQVPQYLIIFRQEYDVWIEDVERPAFLLLQGMIEGKDLATLSEAVPLACGLSPEEGQQVFAERFGQWIENGIIREILL